MNFKQILIFLIVFSCVPIEIEKEIKFNQVYSNAGFTLIYDDKYYKEKKITKKLDDRSLVIFQKNLKNKSDVKITNLANGKSLIAKVGPKSKYPEFYNSVISKRISKEIELDPSEPYIIVKEIDKNSTFVANKSKTFEEEREVAEKAPVDEIGIKNLSETIEDVKKIDDKKVFKYVIKIGDFYYLETANLLKKRVKNEIKIKNVKINEITKTKFRVYSGPYENLESIKKDFYKILQLKFENIEIIKI